MAGPRASWGGSSRAAASLWVGRRRCCVVVGGSSPLLRRCGWVFACCCVAVARSRVGLRKGLDRSRGSGPGWVCGVRLGLRSLLRRCDAEWGRSPKGPRPEQGLWAPVGLRGAATMLPLRVIYARFFPCVDRSSRMKNRGDDQGSRTGRDSPSPWNGPRQGRITDHPPHESPRMDAGFCLRVQKPERCCVHDGIRPRTQHPSHRHARTQNVASAGSRAPRARPTPEPAAGRGPFGAQVDSQPQRRSRTANVDRGATSTGKWCSRRCGYRRRPTHSVAAAWQDPADLRSSTGTSPQHGEQAVRT